MIVCLACGNCTDSRTCEVCGMVLSTDDSHEKDPVIPDLPYEPRDYNAASEEYPYK